jgi:hypothetical protein
MTTGPSDIMTVESITEEYEYIAAHKCACGGSWAFEMQGACHGAEPGTMIDEITVRCSSCSKQNSFRFQVKIQNPVDEEDLAEFLAEMEQELDDDE